MSASDELFEVANRFERAAAPGGDPKVTRPIQARVDAANRAAAAHSGSWLGYQSRIYQRNLEARPGAVFDSQWGLTRYELGDSRGDWGEFDPEVIKAHIRSAAGDADFSAIEQAAKGSTQLFNQAKSDLVSTLHAYNASNPDGYLAKLLKEAEKLDSLSEGEALIAFRPSGPPNFPPVSIRVRP